MHAPELHVTSWLGWLAFGVAWVVAQFVWHALHVLVEDARAEARRRRLLHRKARGA